MEIINLNVGGVLYTTTRITLCNDPNSMLGAMFNGTMESTKDGNGRYFIDRDGKLFKFILNYLRCSELALPKDFKGLKQLRLEACFYKLNPLVETIDGLLVPKQLEYLFIEHNNNNGIIQYIIHGRADLIKKYFPALIDLGKLHLYNKPTYDEILKCRREEEYHPMKYAAGLLHDGWKLAGSTSTAMGNPNGSNVMNRDMWSLEK